MIQLTLEDRKTLKKLKKMMSKPASKAHQEFSARRRNEVNAMLDAEEKGEQISAAALSKQINARTQY